MFGGARRAYWHTKGRTIRQLGGRGLGGTKRRLGRRGWPAARVSERGSSAPDSDRAACDRGHHAGKDLLTSSSAARRELVALRHPQVRETLIRVRDDLLNVEVVHEFSPIGLTDVLRQMRPQRLESLPSVLKLPQSCPNDCARARITSGRNLLANELIAIRAEAQRRDGHRFDAILLWVFIISIMSASLPSKRGLRLVQACLTLKPTSPLSVFRSLEAGFAERARKAMDAVAARRNTVSGVWSAMEPARWARGADGPAWRSRFRLFSRDGEGRVSRAV